MGPRDVILVPLDGSDLAERALTVAAALARRHGSALRLVHVHLPLAAIRSMWRVSPSSMSTFAPSAAIMKRRTWNAFATVWPRA